jgi:hypothetical protein
VGATTFTGNTRKKRSKKILLRIAVTAILKTEKVPTRLRTEAAATGRKRCLAGKSWQPQVKETPGKRFVSKFATPEQSFAAAHSSSVNKCSQHCKRGWRSSHLCRSKQTNSDQSVRASCLNSSSVDDMFKAAAVVQQTITELNGPARRRKKQVTITNYTYKASWPLEFISPLNLKHLMLMALTNGVDINEFESS